ncbi:histidine phosphatase family protein [Paracidovorax sp. MALMAid1276]|uniref:histidine phosphatase family protein n=1 Tax=Paracidovorax sp. MALMAid1276 TaxID=3411631 RepID=UPI003B9A89D2
MAVNADVAAAPPLPPPPRLWLVRHAAPLIEPGVCYGVRDVAADPAATRAAAQRLASALPTAALVWHSTLQRCELLALDLQALRPDLAPNPDTRLREMDFGSWEGQAWDAIGKPAIDVWTGAFHTHAPGGGESLQAMLARVDRALHAARQCHAELAARDVVWITHAGVARCVDWLLAHGPSAPPEPGTWPVHAPAWGHWVIRSLRE